MKIFAFLVICAAQIINAQEKEEFYGCYNHEVCVDPYYCQSGSIDGNTLERNYYYVCLFNFFLCVSHIKQSF